MKKTQAGNPEPLVTVGRVTKEWGLKGEVLVSPLTFDPGRLWDLKKVAIEFKLSQNRQGTLQWVDIVPVRHHGNLLLIGIKGVETPEDARKYRGALIQARQSESPGLPEGVYYQHQIIGLSVYTVAGERLGTVDSIMETGSNDVYVIKGSGKEYLLPAISDVIKKIDVVSGEMVVTLMAVAEE